MKKLTILMSAALIGLNLTACSTTTLMTAGVKKGDERNFVRSLSDVNAGRAIKARMSRVEGFELSGVNVDVGEGIVVLSGHVPRGEDRIEAERIAWSAPKVVQVGNEVLIKGKQGFVRAGKDVVLNTSIRTRLTAAKTIKARNYNIEVNDGIVYLLGVARTPDELAAAAHIASTTKGTREVVSYVRIAADHSRLNARGPGFNGQPNTGMHSNGAPSTVAAIPYGGGTYGGGTASQSYTPLTQAPFVGQSRGAIPDTNLPAIPSPQSLPQSMSQALPQVDGDAIDSGEPYYRDPKTGQRITLPDGVKPIPYVPDTGPGSLGAGGTPLPGAVAGARGAYNIDPLTGNMVPVVYSGQ